MLDVLEEADPLKENAKFLCFGDNELLQKILCLLN